MHIQAMDFYCHTWNRFWLSVHLVNSEQLNSPKRSLIKCNRPRCSDYDNVHRCREQMDKSLIDPCQIEVDHLIRTTPHPFNLWSMKIYKITLCLGIIHYYVAPGWLTLITSSLRCRKAITVFYFGAATGKLNGNIYFAHFMLTLAGALFALLRPIKIKQHY